MQELLSVLFQSSIFLLWCWFAVRVFSSSKRAATVVRGPLRLFRVMVIIATFGVLGGCTNSDPLAVASGPLFALNAGHWQPAPQDLATPPAIMKQ